MRDVYVSAVDGTDQNPGTVEQPVRSGWRAIELVAPGGTIYWDGPVRFPHIIPWGTSMYLDSIRFVGNWIDGGEPHGESIMDRATMDAKRSPDVPVFLLLASTVSRIAASDGSWEEKYDLIFSDRMAGRIRRTGVTVDWDDPDTSYEEDVRAYARAVEQRAQEIGRDVVLRGGNEAPS